MGIFCIFREWFATLWEMDILTTSEELLHEGEHETSNGVRVEMATLDDLPALTELNARNLLLG